MNLNHFNSFKQHSIHITWLCLVFKFVTHLTLSDLNISQYSTKNKNEICNALSVTLTVVNDRFN